MILSIMIKKLSKHNIIPLYHFGNNTFQALPFKIKVNEARTIMKQQRGFFFETIPDIPNQGQKLHFVQAFLPFYSANVSNVRTSYKGTCNVSNSSHQINYDKKGKPYYNTSSNTDKIAVKGVLDPTDYSFECKDLQVYADFQFPRKAVQSAVTQDLTKNQLQKLDVNALKFQGRKKQIKKHKMSNQFAIQKVIQKIQQLQKKRAQQYQAQNLLRQQNLQYHVSVHSVSINRQQLQITLIKFYLPAYIFKSKMAEDVYKIVGGYSGKSSGLQLYNSTKIGLSTMVFATLIGLISQASSTSFLFICSLSYCFGHSLGAIWNAIDRKQFHYQQKQKQNDLITRIQQQQQDMMSLIQQRVITLTESQATTFGVDSIKIYSKDQFLQICDDKKTQIIETNKSRLPKQTISLLKQIDKIQTEVLKRNNVN